MRVNMPVFVILFIESEEWCGTLGKCCSHSQLGHWPRKSYVNINNVACLCCVSARRVCVSLQTVPRCLLVPEICTKCYNVVQKRCVCLHTVLLYCQYLGVWAITWQILFLHNLLHNLIIIFASYHLYYKAM